MFSRLSTGQIRFAPGRVITALHYVNQRLFPAGILRPVQKNKQNRVKTSTAPAPWTTFYRYVR